MSETMGTHDTQAQRSDTDQEVSHRQQTLTHVDDGEDTKRASPSQGMRTQNVTTPEDARAEDQRLDGVSVQQSGTVADRSHDDLGTPVKK